MSRHRSLLAGPSLPCSLVGNPCVLILMAINAQQLPVAAIERVIVVIVILVVHRQFAQTHAGELTAASSANVRIEFHGAFTVSRLALAAVPARFGDDSIETRLIRVGRFRHIQYLYDRDGFVLQSGLSDLTARLSRFTFPIGATNRMQYISHSSLHMACPGAGCEEQWAVRQIVVLSSYTVEDHATKYGAQRVQARLAP